VSNHSKILKDFINDCSKGTQLVFISKGAMLTVQTDLNIKTMKEAIAFISVGGLENPTYIKSVVWENNQHKDKGEICTNEWAFFAGPLYGYISFVYQPHIDDPKWIVKSLKKNLDPDPRLQPITRFEDKLEMHNYAFKGLGDIIKKVKEQEGDNDE
jgi:hypothetical protein